MSVTIERPAPDEYNVFYAGYIRRVPAGDIFDTLTRQIDEVQQLLGPLSEAQAAYRFADNQWSIREVVGHLIDTEQIMAYRALCLSRGEKSSLPGFEQDDYVTAGHFDDQPLSTLLETFSLLRRATIAQLRPMRPEASTERGTVNGFPASARAMVYIIAGHVAHHLESLRTDYDVQSQAV